MEAGYQSPRSRPLRARPPEAKVLLLFVDGVGLAPAGDSNPLSRLPTPAIAQAAGAPLVAESAGRSEDRVLLPLDTGLGVPGLPQSATGQTAPFTGVNAPRLMGRHVTAYPGPRLKAVIFEHSLFRRAREAGLAATFANAYTSAYIEAVAAGEQRASVTTRAAMAAGLRSHGVQRPAEADPQRGGVASPGRSQDLLARGRADFHHGLPGVLSVGGKTRGAAPMVRSGPREGKHQRVVGALVEALRTQPVILTTF